MFKKIINVLLDAIVGKPTPAQLELAETIRQQGTPEQQKVQADRLAVYREAARQIVEDDTKRAKREARSKKRSRGSDNDRSGTGPSSDLNSSCD